MAIYGYFDTLTAFYISQIKNLYDNREKEKWGENADYYKKDFWVDLGLTVASLTKIPGASEISTY